MAAGEDKKFDAVLGGFLLNDLRVRAGHLHCPGSDTLAAYHERSLLPDEMNSWKEHIVGCARCQAILVELEATNSITVEVSEREVPTPAAVGAGVAGVQSSFHVEAPLPLPTKPRITPISRGVPWKWLAPAGAIAAGLLVWVAWHENRTQLNAPGEVKTAKLEPPAAPPPSYSRDGRETVSADEVARVSKDPAAIGTAAAAKPAPEARGLKQFEKSASKVAPAKPTTRENSKALESYMPPADKEVGTRADAALDSRAAANRAQNQPAQDAKAGVPGAASQTVEVQTANAQLQNQQIQQNLQAQQNQSNEQKTSGPNPSRHAERAKKLKSETTAAPPPAPTAPAAAFSESIRPTSTLAVGGFVQPLISAPGGKSLWRVGHMGMIEFSGDGGASWLRQVSNVFVDLAAGSAPSDKVCWIVGRAGVILLTTDAGAHWAAIHSPLDEDLGRVRATDALHATIWNLANTRVFETSDGGTIWKPATSP